MGSRKAVTLAVYRLDLGVGAKEFAKEVYRLAAEAGPSVASVVPLPAKPLRDLLAGRKDYSSYRRVVNSLTDRVSAVVGSERVYVGPAAMRYGRNTFLSVVEAVSRSEVSRKFVKFGPEFKGYVPRSPVVDVRGVSVCFLLLDDLFYPEVSRYCAESGCSTLIGVVPPVAELDPDLVILAARMRAYENSASVVVVGGYSREYSTPTVVVKRDGSLADVAEDSRPEVLEIQLSGDRVERPRSEVVRSYYAKTIRALNSLREFSS